LACEVISGPTTVLPKQCLCNVFLWFTCACTVLSIYFHFNRISRRGWMVLTKMALSSSHLVLEWNTCQKM